MKINIEALKSLELKLAEFSKENGTIAEHESSNKNGCNSCSGGCMGGCGGGCYSTCIGGCKRSRG